MAGSRPIQVRSELPLVAGALLLALAACGDDGGAPPAEDTSAGETAVWHLASDKNLVPSSTSFVALVSRLECSSGVTGTVLPPEIEMTTSEIVVTFSVKRRDPKGLLELPRQ